MSFLTDESGRLTTANSDAHWKLVDDEWMVLETEDEEIEDELDRKNYRICLDGIFIYGRYGHNSDFSCPEPSGIYDDFIRAGHSYFTLDVREPEAFFNACTDNSYLVL